MRWPGLSVRLGIVPERVCPRPAVSALASVKTFSPIGAPGCVMFVLGAGVVVAGVRGRGVGGAAWSGELMTARAPFDALSGIFHVAFSATVGTSSMLFAGAGGGTSLTVTVTAAGCDF